MAGRLRKEVHVNYVPTMDFGLQGMKHRQQLLADFETWSPELKAETKKILKANSGMTPWQAIERAIELMEIGLL